MKEKLKGIENLYQKIILTVIAIALISLCVELGSVVNGLNKIARNLPETFDGYIQGGITID